MKSIKLVVFGIALFLGSTLQAQVSVTFNLGSPPSWGPAGYSEVRYYYLPDIESYYDIQLSQFIYFNGIAWVHRAYLPTRYRDYDLYNGYKVVMNDYRGNTPYSNFREYKTKYARGYHGEAQRSIGERPGKGNNDMKKYSKDKSSQKSNRRNVKRSEHGNENEMKDDHNQGNGNDKRR